MKRILLARKQKSIPSENNWFRGDDSIGIVCESITCRPLISMDSSRVQEDLDSPLPNPSRHITDNDTDGKSFFSKAVPMSVPVVRDLGGALQRLAYIAPKGPGVLTHQADLKTYMENLKEVPPLVPSGGSAIVWYIDTPPDSASPMHRTVSLDLVIQIEGEIELSLESGEVRTMQPGDLTIQRSTLHAWRNKSKTKWSRMVGIMAECQPVQIGEKTLGTEFLIH